MQSSKTFVATFLCASCVLAALHAMDTRAQPSSAQSRKPWLIAHRGASAYAPENTIPAFELAAAQGATYVEFDLQLTKDREIVCLHDETLERTTDVEEVFPDRARVAGSGADAKRRWLLADFTLAELKRLDAGAWFDRKYRGTRIPTFAETIDALRGKSGLFIELKLPEKYDGVEKLVLAALEAKGLHEPGADPRTPVLLQSFSLPSVQILSQSLKTLLPVHFIFGARDAAPWVTDEGLAKLKSLATGITPEKTIVKDRPEMMARARALGLLVTPYTFRSSAVTGFPDVRAEMKHYLDAVQVDGVITDNPDQMPPSTATATR